MKNISTLKKGFTLVELIVVIAIIGILTGIVTTNFASSRSRARDAKRISDLGHIQLALELYFDRCKQYPQEEPASVARANISNRSLLAQAGEESSPPIEESTPPIEESTPPVEESTPPVEESTPPMESSTPPVESSVAAQTSTPPVESSPAGGGSSNVSGFTASTAANNCSSTGVTFGQYISKIPSPPEGGAYDYVTNAPSGKPTTYLLHTTLENYHEVLKDASTDNSVATGVSCDISTFNYCLTPQ
jgi:prepilin-type N-terminal cleavage/methylation domain-containing protein